MHHPCTIHVLPFQLGTRNPHVDNISPATFGLCKGSAFPGGGKAVCTAATHPVTTLTVTLLQGWHGYQYQHSLGREDPKGLIVLTRSNASIHLLIVGPTAEMNGAADCSLFAGWACTLRRLAALWLVCIISPLSSAQLSSALLAAQVLMPAQHRLQPRWQSLLCTNCCSDGSTSSAMNCTEHSSRLRRSTPGGANWNSVGISEPPGHPDSPGPRVN